MGKKYRNLFDQLVSPENMALAYKKTMKGKRRTWGYLEFKEYDRINLAQIQSEIISGEYQPDEYSEFMIYDPKKRLISALPFKDRLAQHALCNVIAPIFDKSLLPYTFACREGLGTHAGVRHIQSLMRSQKPTHFIKTDFSKFFPSIDRPILHRMIKKKITCRKTYDLLCKFMPPEGMGVPIGSLTSQVFANVYGGMIDRFVHFELGYRHWARYMDDVIILGDDFPRMRNDIERIKEFSLSEMNMRLSKHQVAPIGHGVNFLGYRIWPTHKLLRKDSVQRARRKIKAMQARGDTQALEKFLAAWYGHASWADTQNLLKHMEATYGISRNQYTRRSGRGCRNKAAQRIYGSPQGQHDAP
jgi:RNA-directed DNA polymerase